MIADTRQDAAGYGQLDVLSLHSSVECRPADFSALGERTYSFPGTADVVMDESVVLHGRIVSYSKQCGNHHSLIREVVMEDFLVDLDDRGFLLLGVFGSRHGMALLSEVLG